MIYAIAWFRFPKFVVFSFLSFLFHNRKHRSHFHIFFPYFNFCPSCFIKISHLKNGGKFLLPLLPLFKLQDPKLLFIYFIRLWRTSPTQLTKLRPGIQNVSGSFQLYTECPSPWRNGNFFKRISLPMIITPYTVLYFFESFPVAFFMVCTRGAFASDLFNFLLCFCSFFSCFFFHFPM